MNNQYRYIIRETGLKVTPARLAVIKFFYRTKKPAHIADIIKALVSQRIYADQATIYRIVENFYEKGLINRLQFQKRKFYYETNREEHHHAICSSCGKIEDISNCSLQKLEKEIEKKHNFKVESHSLEFFGTCSNCLQK